jgi:hypothetical protein
MAARRTNGPPLEILVSPFQPHQAAAPEFGPTNPDHQK